MIKKKDYELIAEAYDLVLEGTKKGKHAWSPTCNCASCLHEYSKAEEKDEKQRAGELSSAMKKLKKSENKPKKKLNECWDEIRKNPKQLKKVEDIVGTEGHEKNNDYHMEMQGDKVVIKHKIKGSNNEAERDIIVDKDGEENVHVHQGVHKESKDSIASHATLDPDELISHYGNIVRADFTNHAAAGGLAGAQYLKGKKQGLPQPNNYDKKSQAYIEWQKEFDKVVKANDKLNKKAVESGDVPTKDGSEVKESYLSQNKKDNGLLTEAYFRVISEASEKKCKWCAKGCRCGKCKDCTPKKGEKVCKKCKMLESKCKCK